MMYEKERGKEEKAAQILKNLGFKRTPGRIALLSLLLEAETPLTQQEISRQLDKEMNYVNIYRALDAFIKAGIVHKVETGEKNWRFALCTCNSKGHCHPHFICQGCGLTECLSEFQVPQISLSAEGYVVQSQEMYLKGLCASCSSRATNTLKPAYELLNTV